ncbi:YHYH protein [Luteolibacter sp. AS25]|uniref:YHYH protein n=1 Tax=Luteolibacter sp. AS25 TaxID=3135776 RepID=UPI00398AD6DF
MKYRFVIPLFAGFSVLSANAHEISSSADHHHDNSSEGAEKIAKQATPPSQAEYFGKFSPRVNLRWDDSFLYIESNGLPQHDMMTGITAWQQQVPLPQDYTGENAWRIPLLPVPAAEPRTVKNEFLRGAIAIAVNGIPIFNPQNNRGELSQEIGELDQWGGHCGRADDYHYHAAPLHLEEAVGKGNPIAYALDGYPILGLAEPDGSKPEGLDEFNGHTTEIGYHYHSSEEYPYVNGGFHGEVTEIDGQVDPQPRAQVIREAGEPLPGAEITDFESTAENAYKVSYKVEDEKRTIAYSVNPDGSYTFEFKNGESEATKETYTPQAQGSPPRNGNEKAPQERPSEPDSEFGPDALKKPNDTFILTSPEVENGGDLPVDFTGDGSGATLPLSWKGVPEGTKSFALVMDHLTPDNTMKHYWTLWDIPTTVTELPKNVTDIGTIGTGFNGHVGYEPPHSKGPGAKTYVLTVYALSEPLEISQAPAEVDRDVLLSAMKGKVLASSSLDVVYTRNGEEAGTPPPAGDRSGPPTSIQEQPNSDKPAKGTGRPDDGGLIKPQTSDTITVSAYADNWFMLYINGKLVAVDPIDFMPHNVVTLDILPEYPMNIAIMAKDNADPKSGLEYGDRIGDAGFIIRFADGTVSDASWKAKSFFTGPLDGIVENPRVETTPIPEDWFSENFDDSSWANATEYSEERVDPKEVFNREDFENAKFIWTESLDLDNTVIFRTRVEKADWKPRWNTKPDLTTPTTKLEP